MSFLRGPWVAIAVVCGVGWAQDGPIRVEAIADLYSSWSRGAEHPGRPTLSSAAVGIERDGERWGFRFKAGAGELFRSTMASDPWRGANRYFTEGYFSLKPMYDGPIRIDAGKFNADPGAEPEEAVDNFNYTRSLVSDFAMPSYHFGIRGAVEVTKALKVGASLVNGWNNVIDNNRGKTVSVSGSWEGKGWSWSHAFLHGPELDGASFGRSLYDTVVRRQFGARIATYAEYAEGHDHVPGSRDLHWRGGSVAGQWKLRRKWAVAQRAGWFADPGGQATGAQRTLTEMTSTVDYRIHPLATWRTEFRCDWERPRGAAGWTATPTVATALMFAFRRGL